MNDLFLDELEVQKCQVYEAFIALPAGDYPANYLKKEFPELTTAKMQTLLTGIQLDITTLTGATHIFFDETKVLVAADLPTLAIYHQYLLAHALPTKVFQSLLLHPEGTVKEFCQENFFSRATVFRKLQSLQAILEPFHLEMNITQLQLSGSEIVIRYFLINVLWALSPHFLDEYPLADEDYSLVVEDIVKVFDERTTFGTREKLRFCLKILDFRRRGGFFAEREIDFTQLPLKNGLVLRHSASFQAALLKSATPTEHVKAEEKCFYFLVFSGPIYISTTTKSYRMFQGWLARDEQPQKIVKKFGDLIIADFFHGKKPDHFDIILANIMSVFNTSLILKETPPLIFMMNGDKTLPNNPLFQHLEKSCSTYFATIARRKNFAWLSPSVPFLARNFAYCLWHTLEAYLHEKTLYVSLLIDANFNFTLPLLAFLNRLNYIEVVPYDLKSAQTIDLLICAHHQLVPADYLGEIFIYTSLAIADNFTHLRRQLDELQAAAYMKAYHIL